MFKICLSSVDIIHQRVDNGQRNDTEFRRVFPDLNMRFYLPLRKGKVTASQRQGYPCATATLLLRSGK